MKLHTIVVSESACDDHLAIYLCLFALRTSPEVLPWLCLWFGGGIAVSANVGEEVFSGGQPDRLFVLRSHPELGQRHQP